MLLVLDNLEDPSCFHQHGALGNLAQRLGTSRLLVTTCNGNLCNVLPGALCFTLTRAENEEHVMFKLMSRLARGTAARADHSAVSAAVKVRYCTHQLPPHALPPRTPPLPSFLQASYVMIGLVLVEAPDHDTLSEASCWFTLRRAVLLEESAACALSGRLRSLGRPYSASAVSCRNLFPCRGLCVDRPGAGVWAHPPVAMCAPDLRTQGHSHAVPCTRPAVCYDRTRGNAVAQSCMPVQASIKSCVTQCQGSPQLLRLVDAAVRLSIMPPDLRSATNTLSNDFAEQWRQCAEQLFPSAAAAQHAEANFGAYDKLNHHVYRHILRQVITARPGSETPPATTRMIKAALRAVIKLNSREWYAWDAVVSFIAAEEAGAVPHGAGRAAGGGSSGTATPAGASARGSPIASSPATSALLATPFSVTPRRHGDPRGSEDSLGFMAWSDVLLMDNITRSPFVAQHDKRLLADVDSALQLLVHHRVLEAQAHPISHRACTYPLPACTCLSFHRLLALLRFLPRIVRGCKIGAFIGHEQQDPWSRHPGGSVEPL